MVLGDTPDPFPDRSPNASQGMALGDALSPVLAYPHLCSLGMVLGDTPTHSPTARPLLSGDGPGWFFNHVPAAQPAINRGELAPTVAASLERVPKKARQLRQRKNAVAKGIPGVAASSS